MADLLANNYKHRRTFAKAHPMVDIGNLIEIQRASYEAFLQSLTPAEDRKNTGLQAVFKSVFPIKDFSNKASLNFVSFDLEAPKYDVEECRERGMTFSAPLKVTVRLVVWEVDAQTEARTVSNVKQQEVYFGEIPLMTENGTFIVNGTERVVVSQLHRSPGIFFDQSFSKTGGGKLIFSARVIPNRGSWIDFEFDTKDILYVRIDRRRKLPATVLLRALGYDTEQLLNYFYDNEVLVFEDGRWFKDTTADLLSIQTASVPVSDPETGAIIVKEGKKFLRPALRKLRKAGVLAERAVQVDGEDVQVEMARIPVAEELVHGAVSAYDVVDMETGLILIECNEALDEENIQRAFEAGVYEFDVLFMDNVMVGSFLRDTLLVDKISSPEEAVIEIYRRLRPGDPPTYETAVKHFNNLFFNAERYDLSEVGRLKLNLKLGLDLPLQQTTLTRDDILRVVKYLIDLKNNKGKIDDIDHLGNRRVRAVGELLENQYRVGLVRMEKAIKERMSLSEIEALMPHDLINAKPVSAVVKEFFGSSQLSQFMDQTNPLSEVTHKRRLSALGPGGLTRERAGFDVRDVHTTHYGRICPIETPEGPNIGSDCVAVHVRAGQRLWFHRDPVPTVTDGRTDWGDQVLLSAGRGEGTSSLRPTLSVMTTARSPMTNCQRTSPRRVWSSSPQELRLIDVSPNQLVSVAASLVPFLENDDANRALMGSNMQRQAVPSFVPRRPLWAPAWSAWLLATRGHRRCRRDGMSTALMPPVSWSRPIE